jgi:type III restriction enzyme
LLQDEVLDSLVLEAEAIYNQRQQCYRIWSALLLIRNAVFRLSSNRKASNGSNPPKANFRFFTGAGSEISEYVPDFAAETQDTIYMVEIKAENQMPSREVQDKKKAGEAWCGYASEHNARNKGKPWKYLLISHESVKENMTLNYYAQNSK